jgi:hypothetical protein
MPPINAYVVLYACNTLCLLCAALLHTTQLYLSCQLKNVLKMKELAGYLKPANLDISVNSGFSCISGSVV